MDKNFFQEATRNLTLTQEQLNELKKEIVEAAKIKPKVKENLNYILGWIDCLKDAILKNRAGNAAVCMRNLNFWLYELDHFKPLYREWASKKPKPKKEEGFFRAIKYAWDHSKRKTALSLWEFLIEGCVGDTFAVKTGIDLIYEKKENKLYYYHPDGTSRKIGFRAFQKYFTEFKKKSQ